MIERTCSRAARSLLLATFVGISGCSSGSNTSANPPTDAAVEVVTDASADNIVAFDGEADSGCSAGTHPTPAGACDTSLSWSDGGSIEAARHHHASFVVDRGAGAKLYVVGGMNATDLLSDARLAAINDDGSLGPWQATESLPKGAAGQGLAIVTDMVIVSGGFATLSGQLSADTWSSRVQSDGTLTPWKSGPPLPSARNHHTMVVHDSRIYSIGGLTSAGSITEVVSATVQADGTVGNWTSVNPLPAPRSHHAAIVHEGWLYVMGGGNVAGAVTPYTDVLRSPINTDGSLGDWTDIATLPINVGTAGLVEFAGSFYLLGGIDASGGSLKMLAQVIRARSRPDGTLDAWQPQAELPVARGHVHQTPLFREHVYSIGGQATDGSALSSVHIGRFE